MRNRILLVAGYVFYGYWDLRFLCLLFLLTASDFYLAGKVHQTQNPSLKKLWLSLSIGINLGVLGFFKYVGFFVQEFNNLLEKAGASVTIPAMEILLPVGISFYTFQKLGFVIDVYRGASQPVKNFLDFALYACFFPLLLAGPIERSTRLLPQISSERKLQPGAFGEGLYQILFGLFKKIVIADNLSPIVNMIFSTTPSRLSGPECAVGVYAFAIQIYCDFSGYSSIAKGIAKWMGIDVMENFKMPYFATTPAEFWSRWHISLSSWLRDYLYIPLGGNRLGSSRTMLNLTVVMILCGLWHGASWTFVIWGLYHGFLLVIYRFLDGPKSTRAVPVNKPGIAVSCLKALLLFNLVCLGWLVFRAESMGQAWDMLVRITTNIEFTHLFWFALGMLVFFAGPLFMMEYLVFRSADLLKPIRLAPGIQTAFFTYIVLMIIVFQTLTGNEFIYFRF